MDFRPVYCTYSYDANGNIPFAQGFDGCASGIKIVGHKFDVSVVNSNQTKCESRQKNIDETLLKDDEFSVPSCAHKSPEDGKLLKCFYCENKFTHECHRTIPHKTDRDKKKSLLCKQNVVYRSNQKICEVTHTGKKSIYKCSYCEKGFSRPSSLQIHERTHTGERPFKCSFCNKQFSESGSVKRHERTHTGEKPFKCSFCNNQFSESGSMKRHERTHTGITSSYRKCSYCHKWFSKLCNLRVHERLHSVGKLFKNSHQKDEHEQASSLVIRQVGTQNEGSVERLTHQEEMHFTGGI